MYHTDFESYVDCEFGRIFQIALNEAKAKEENLNYFDFYTIPLFTPNTPKEAELAIDFSKTCLMFCIVNPKTNHVISFRGVGNGLASILQNLLDFLKSSDF